MPEKILIIKLSALGDFVQSLGLMSAIIKHHPDAHITLLTTKPFKKMAEKCGYFNEILIDTKPKIFNISDIISLRKKLIAGNFSRVYDLQNNNRTSLYYKFFPKKNKPEWIGNIKEIFAKNKPKQKQHAFDRHKQTLELAGVKDIQTDRLEWMREDISEFDLTPPYIIFVSGSAPKHPQKRWSKEKYGELACRLTKLGYQIIILGTSAEKDVNQAIHKICPSSLNLTGKTSLFQIVTLAHGAAAAVGNDTGPMHIIGPTGCPTLVLFSSYSDPICHAPKGDNISTLQRDSLDDLEIMEVFETVKTNLS